MLTHSGVSCMCLHCMWTSMRFACSEHNMNIGFMLDPKSKWCRNTAWDAMRTIVMSKFVINHICEHWGCRDLYMQVCMPVCVRIHVIVCWALVVCYCHSMGCCVCSKGPGVPVSSGAVCSDGMVMPNCVMGQRCPSCLHGPGLRYVRTATWTWVQLRFNPGCTCTHWTLFQWIGFEPRSEPIHIQMWVEASSTRVNPRAIVRAIVI